jgi:hypothetical protein
MLQVLVVATAALAVGLLAAGARGAPATTQPADIHIIDVTVTNARAQLAPGRVVFQSIVEFRVRNRTAVVRTFKIGGLQTRIRAQGAGILLMHFPERGKFPYAFVGPKGSQPLRGVFRVV